jgi:hypothetical protein
MVGVQREIHRAPQVKEGVVGLRRTYHGQVRDELVSRALKEKSLASSVKGMVYNIGDLQEIWDTLDPYFDLPENISWRLLTQSSNSRSIERLTVGPTGSSTRC